MEVNKMKIYAKQVPPEYQESPLFMEDWPENVFVFGNRHYTAHAERLEDIKRALEDISDVCNGYGYTNNLLDVIPDRDDGREYTRQDRLEFVALAEEYAETGTRDEKSVLCDVLELITGDAWEYSTLRGCCQGDWQEIIYPAKYGAEWLEQFETEYFNTGAEWRISENDPESDDNYYFYSHSWNDDGIRAEIAAAAGVDPGDVILYTFTGWIRTPEYTEA
jgi:hypothetical protein